MSDVLKVAEQLRKLDDQLISQLIKRCQINPSPAKDFFDLAASFLQTKSQDAWLNTANRTTLEQLRSAVETHTEKQQQTFADPMFGISVDRLSSDPKLLDLVTAKLSADQLKTEVASKPATTQELADSGIRAFLTVLAITEFVYELEHRYLREVGKHGLALPDVKRFSAHLGLDADLVKQIWEIARLSGVVTSLDSRWVLGEQARAWLDSPTTLRWQLLANSWFELLGSSANEDLKEHFKQPSSLTLSESFGWIYPLSDAIGTTKQLKVTDFAEVIGLTANGSPAPWFYQVVAADFAGATKAIAKHFPATSSRIIVQADLSIVAPGPLDQKVEKGLRRFLDADKVGLASHFRISALSVSYALESGLAIGDIRTELSSLSEKTLPQPVEYLLTEVAKRFGRIKVIADSAGSASFVEVTEPTLALELANDVRLRSLGLRQIEALRLFTKFSTDVAYFTLRDNGHLAVRLDARGKLISPEKNALSVGASDKVSPVESSIERLRAADSVGGSSDDETKLRQVQLAIKNKANIRVVYVGRDGGEYQFVLEPIGLANGRLRGRDRKADIERTLPMTNIITLELT